MDMLKIIASVFVFAVCAFEGNRRTGDIRDGWRKACETLSEYAEETAVLEELGKTLGSFDKESTLAHLKRSAEEIAEFRKTAEEEYARRGKPLSRVWTLCGLGLAILII